ncbi:MAG: hypothetical protein LH702_25185 [Phormidesmis sp. CAN_BIN44]|nr:hypothetical protein [Phormidesmis sp. CAN_BIN44]
MKVKVTEEGLVIPKELLEGIQEFEIRKENHQLVLIPTVEPDPMPLDFRQSAGLGQDIWQSVNVEQYIEQERAAWD